MIEQKFIINNGSQIILLLLVNQTQLQITVQQQSYRNVFFTAIFTKDTMPKDLINLIDTPQELYNRLKQLTENQLKFQFNKLIPKATITYEINIFGQKKIKQINLNPTKLIPEQKRKIKDYIHQYKIIELNKKIHEKLFRIQDLSTNIEERQSLLMAQTFSIEQKEEQIKRIQNKKQTIQKQIQIQTKLQSSRLKKAMSNIQQKKIEQKSEIKQVKSKVISKSNIQLKAQQKKQQQKLVPTLSLLKPLNPQILPPPPSSTHKFMQRIEKQVNKTTLQLKNQKVNDQDIKSMIGYDWNNIDILSLGANQITDQGFLILNTQFKWTNVRELFLFANQITDITSLKIAHQLRILSLYQNNLNQKSCDFFISTKWNNLLQLYLTFNEQIIQKCWIKLVKTEFVNFPKLNKIQIQAPQLITAETRVQINKLCRKRNINLRFGFSKDQCNIS